MATSETAKLLASLELKDKFSPALKNANRALGQFDTKLSKTEGRAYRAGQQIGTGFRNVGKLAVAGAGILAANVALGLNSLIELEKQQAQTNAVIKSTGGIAGVTAEQVGRLAEKYEGLNATVGDEVIREGQNLLLTFTNIRQKAFEPALATALDMNTALGKGPDGLTGTVKILGKALNDPTKGLGALSRVGITFSKEQAERIKQLQKEGKLYEAQTIILGELDKRFGGSFLAQGGTTAGKVAKFTDSIEDLQRALATAVLPAVGNVADALTELLADPEIIRGAEALGQEIGKVFSKENIKTGAKALGDVFKFMRDAAPAVGAALGTIGSVLSTAVKAFTSLPKEVQALLIGGVAVNKLTNGLITNIAGGIFGALKAMTVQAGVVNVTGATVTGGGGVPGGPVKGGLGALSKVFLVGEAIGLAALVVAVQQGLSNQNTEIAEGIRVQTNEFIKSKPDTAALQNALAGVNQGISDIQSNPLNVLVQGEALEKLRSMRAELSKALTARGEGVTANDREGRTSTKPIVPAIDDLRGEFVAQQRDVKTKLAANALAVQRKGEQTVRAVDGSKTAISTATRTGAIQTTNATRSGANSIVAAIHAIPPPVTYVDVDVSNKSITTVNTKTNRRGPSGGSRTDSGNVGGKVIGDPRN